MADSVTSGTRRKPQKELSALDPCQKLMHEKIYCNHEIEKLNKINVAGILHFSESSFILVINGRFLLLYHKLYACIFLHFFPNCYMEMTA